MQRSAAAASDTAWSESLGAAFGDFSGAAPGAADFRDLAGNDTYVVDNRAAATAGPPGDVLAGEGQSSAAGSVTQNSVAAFLDQGGTDTFTIAPADPACDVGAGGAQRDTLFGIVWA